MAVGYTVIFNLEFAVPAIVLYVGLRAPFRKEREWLIYSSHWEEAMRRFGKRLTKCLLAGTLFMTYQMSGCTLDQATIQSFLDTLGASSEIKFEFEIEHDGHAGEFEEGDDTDSD